MARQTVDYDPTKGFQPAAGKWRGPVFTSTNPDADNAQRILPTYEGTSVQGATRDMMAGHNAEHRFGKVEAAVRTTPTREIEIAYGVTATPKDDFVVGGKGRFSCIGERCVRIGEGSTVKPDEPSLVSPNAEIIKLGPGVISAMSDKARSVFGTWNELREYAGQPQQPGEMPIGGRAIQLQGFGSIAPLPNEGVISGVKNWLAGLLFGETKPVVDPGAQTKPTDTTVPASGSPPPSPAPQQPNYAVYYIAFLVIAHVTGLLKRIFGYKGKGRRR